MRLSARSKIIWKVTLSLGQPSGATFFVTFHLAGVLSRSVLSALNAETKKQVRQITAVANTPDYDYQFDLIQRQYFGRWDSYLDAAEQGPTWLRAPQAAQLICTYLLLYVDQRYELDVFCIMPNHVHLLIRPLPQTNAAPFPLIPIIESLKAETAVGVNRILGRDGQLWYPENYIHIVRDTAEAQRITNYIVENPVKAGLAATWDAWPWTYVTST